PLCGNGMSMALHASKLAAIQVARFLQGNIDRTTMEREYSMQWQSQFAKRLRMGRMIQRMFGSEALTNALINVTRRSPTLVNYLVKQTHGAPF
ncbi:MAG: pyridine nucleotide-disulfide oxidoreductase, partial [Chitinophagaceae bacterium]|nr:pyridine nucleotide-disulfide oxidoreductase [Chitinophagaceae bacterium]